ncbi:MAG: lipopolysaccharide biosynthesis protein [Candidatus Sumerlaeota bacterium]|nr:lipopolysaccharide biosynthesis protein [Candidatus Sumerlaeota bacterium]
MTAETSLKRRVAFAVGWNALATAVSTVSQFVLMAVLSRHFSNADFGLIGHIMVVTNFLILIGELGVSASVIQAPKISSGALLGLFLLNVVGGAGFAALLAVGAPLYAGFYHTSDLIWLLRWASLSLVMQAIGGIHRALLQKGLQYRRLSMIEATGAMTQVIIASGLALAGRGPMAYVIATILRYSLESAILWMNARWRPTWRDARRLRETAAFLPFGLFLTGERIVNYIAMYSPNWIIPKMLGVSQFGIYTFAYLIVNQPVQRLTAVLVRVFFPSLSLLQHDERRFARGYYNCTKWTFAILAPAMMGLWALAPEIVLVFFSPAKASAIPALRALCFLPVILSLGSTTGAVLYSKKRSDIGLLGNALILCLLPPILVAASRFGILCVIWAQIAFSLVSAPAWVLVLGRLAPIRLSRLLAHIARPAMACAVMTGVVLLVKTALVHWGAGMEARIAVCVPLGVLVYGGALFLLAPEYWKDLRHFLTGEPLE